MFCNTLLIFNGKATAELFAERGWQVFECLLSTFSIIVPIPVHLDSTPLEIDKGKGVEIDPVLIVAISYPMERLLRHY